MPFHDRISDSEVRLLLRDVMQVNINTNGLVDTPQMDTWETVVGRQVIAREIGLEQIP